MAYARPKTVVSVVFNFPGTGANYCTGVVLRNKWILTAAHCLFKGSNTVPDLDDDELWTDKPLSPSFPGRNYATMYFINPDFNQYLPDFDDDYALVKVSNSYTEADMDLSDHSDSTLQTVGASFHTLQIPKYTLTSTDICSNRGDTVVHECNANVTQIQAIRLRWKGDGTEGASGSPLYFCPEGTNSVCGGGEKGHVVSVLAGYTTFYDRYVGPRSSEFFDWAQTIMDTE